MKYVKNANVPAYIQIAMKNGTSSMLGFDRSLLIFVCLCLAYEMGFCRCRSCLLFPTDGFLCGSW
jgi:hypothetical protein